MASRTMRATDIRFTMSAFPYSNPVALAVSTASRRLTTPSFRYTDRMCAFTVFTET